MDCARVYEGMNPQGEGVVNDQTRFVISDTIRIEIVGSLLFSEAQEMTTVAI